MNVLFTSPALFGAKGVYGGGERYATELARAVAHEAGRATLYAAADRDVDWCEGALRIVTRRPWALVRGQRANPLPRGLWPLIAEADVVHCFQQHIVLTSAAAAEARLHAVPAFCTDLGGGGWDISGYVDTSDWFAGQLHLSRYAAQVAGRDGDPRDAVLYGGVGDETEQTNKKNKTSKNDDGSVLFVGRLFPHKGADVLLEAAEPDWNVIVCGRPYDERYQRDLLALASGKQVRFLSDVDDTQLDALYRKAAVVVVPSCATDRYGRNTRVSELLGLVALEAMARGVAVVASLEASLPELVEDGVTGVLVPPRDSRALRAAVAALLAAPERRAELGAAARSRVAERFTWSRAANVAVDAYARALAA